MSSALAKSIQYTTKYIHIYIYIYIYIYNGYYIYIYTYIYIQWMCNVSDFTFFTLGHGVKV